MSWRSAIGTASIALVVAGCGQPDAGVDAGSDAAATSVRVQMYAAARGAFEGGVVLSYDAADALIERATTDASGSATVTVADKGSIVAVRPSPEAPALWSFVDVVAGDVLIAGDPTPPCDAGIVGGLKVEVPAIGGATSYLLNAPAASLTAFTAGTKALSIAGCTGAPFAVFVVGRDAVSNLQWASATIDAFSDGATVPMGFAQPFRTFALTLVGIPVGGQVHAVRHDTRFEFPQFSSAKDTNTVTSKSTVALEFAPGFADAAIYELTVFVDNKRQRYHLTGSVADTTTTVDLAPLRLPEVIDRTFVDRTLAWTVASEPARFDGTYAVASFARGTWRATWTVIAPEKASEHRLPDLPPDLAELAPLPDDTHAVEQLILLEHSAWSGDRDFRNQYTDFVFRHHGTFIAAGDTVRTSE